VKSLRSVKYYVWPTLIYIAVSALLVVHAYREARQDALHEIDRILAVAVALLPGQLPPDFHDRAVAPGSIALEEELANRDKVNALAALTGITYLYTLVPYQDGLYFSAPTVTPEEAQRQPRWYFHPYADAPEAFRQALETGRPTVYEYADQWGTFRTLITPMRSPGGRVYLACADYDMAEVKASLREHLTRVLAFSLCTFASCVPFFFATRRVTRRFHNFGKSLVEINASLRDLAARDELTGVLNRRSFFQGAQRMLEQMHAYAESGALLMIDLDNFKQINRAIGHLGGDRVLKRIAGGVGRTLRANDLLGRYGGVEFVVFVPKTTPEDALSAAERIRRTIEDVGCDPAQGAPGCTASIGLILVDDGVRTVEDAVAQADELLFKAKDLGKNKVVDRL